MLRKIYLSIASILTSFFLISLFIAPSANASFDLSDKSGNGNNLTNHGATEYTTDFPFTGSTEAVKLVRSSQQYLSATSSTSLSITGNLTMESWIKLTTLPSGTNSSQTIASKFNSDGTTGYSYLWTVATDGSGNLGMVFETDDVGNNPSFVHVNYSFSTGTWYHVAVVYDASAGSAEFFVNGTSIGSQSGLTHSIVANSTPFVIGAFNLGSGGVEFFDGEIDELRVWNVKRTATQIQDNMSNELTGTETGLAAYYPFEGLPQPNWNLTDKSGNGNTLTNHGATEYTADFPFIGSTEAVKLVRSSVQYLSAASSSSLSITSDLSMESWIKLNSLPTGNQTSYTIAGKYNSNGTDGYAYLWTVSTDGSGNVGMNLGIDNVGNSPTFKRENYSFSTGTWYHVAVVYNASAGSAEWFVNGTSIGSQSGLPTSIVSNSSPFVIGAFNTLGTPIEAFDGKIDELRVWNVDRTATQIQNNMSNELSGTETGLVAYYPFEELLQNKITYYMANNGTNFSRSTTPFSSGVSTQTQNTGGTVTASINSTSGYADSGFIIYNGTLGNLPNFTVNGTGNQYSLNLWLDTGGDNNFFAWDTNGVLTGLNSDTYALGPASSSGIDPIVGSSQFYLMSDGQNHSLSDFRNGSVSGISSSTKVTVWVGVNTSSGSTSSTISSIGGLTSSGGLY